MLNAFAAKTTFRLAIENYLLSNNSGEMRMQAPQ